MKLTIHTILCVALVVIFFYRAYDMRRYGDFRLWSTVAQLVTVAYLGAAPWLYKIPGLYEFAPFFFARVTIHPSLLFALTVAVWHYSPRAPRPQLYDSDTDYGQFGARNDPQRPTMH